MKLRKLHRIAGLSGGIVLLLLALTGIALDHDAWHWLSRCKISSSWLPERTVQKERSRFVYYEERSDGNALLAGYGGIYLVDTNRTAREVADLSVTEVLPLRKGYVAATTEGIYKAGMDAKHWYLFALQGERVTSIARYKDTIAAVVDKREIVLVDNSGNVYYRRGVRFDENQTANDITLSRWVRDVHYGRGIFDNGWSLLWNDAAAIWLSFLAVSGYVLFWLIRRIRHKKAYKSFLRNVLRWHTSSVVWIVAIPMVLLALSGIVLDHAGSLGRYVKQVTIPNRYLPPVYHTLKEDIWSIDYSEGVFRIGTRYGVYRSEDLNCWILENPGFAYRMTRRNDKLYVSGMGAPSRILYKKRWYYPEYMPHMFRDVYEKNGTTAYLTPNATQVRWPHFTQVTLYTVLLAMHDGSIFASWWVWMNDMAALMLMLLLVTGAKLWFYRISRRFS